MSCCNFLEKRAIQRYQRENEEQLETIIKLCNALNQPNLAKLFISSVNINFQSEEHTSDRENHEDLKKRIRELEEELELKKNNYKKVEQQIAEYIENAKKFEDLLEKNEKEKEELLLLFQQSSSESKTAVVKKKVNITINTSGMDSSLTLEDLENRVTNKKKECENLEIEASEAKEKCNKLQEQLRSSHAYAKELQQQLALAKSQLSLESPMVKYRDNEETIENLQRQLERANKKLKSLQDDNDMLKKAMVDSEDNEDNVIDDDEANINEIDTIDDSASLSSD